MTGLASESAFVSPIRYSPQYMPGHYKSCFYQASKYSLANYSGLCKQKWLALLNKVCYKYPMTNEAKARAALKALIKKYDGPTGLARAMGNDVTRQMIEQWDLIPLIHLRITKARFGLGLKELRPDIAEYL